MAKNLKIQILKQDEAEKIAAARELAMQRHQAAVDSGKPEAFRFVFETGNVDQVIANGPAYGIFEEPTDCYVLITETVE